jgi:Concanavalin A-like lectin/glucanases superfamily
MLVFLLLVGGEFVRGDCGLNSALAVWHFDEGSGLVAGDSSSNGFDATLHGSVKWTRGVMGSAIQFPAASTTPPDRDYVSVGHQAALSAAFAEITITAWVFPSSFSNAGGGGSNGVSWIGPRILSNTEYSGWALGHAGQADNVQVELRGVTNFILPNVVFPLLAWSHIALSYDGTTVRTFLNGSQVDHREASGRLTAPPSGTSLLIGNEPGDGVPRRNKGDCPWQGSIDEVRIYGCALDPTDIRFLGTATPSCAPPPKGLLSWWRGEHDATDFVGSNDGTLIGDVTFMPGIVGQAFSFNYDGRFASSDKGFPSGSSARTVEAWIKLRAKTVQSTTTLLFGYGTQGMTNAAWSVGVDNRRMGRRPRPNFTLTNWGHDVWTQHEVSPYFWYHFAVTTAGNDVSLYVNGSKVATGVMDITTISSSSFVMGDQPPGVPKFSNQEPLDGLLDEVTVYNRALSLGEIQSVFQAGAKGKCHVSPTSGSYVDPSSTSEGKPQTLSTSSVASNGGRCIASFYS